ncbi:MAG: hypothetical protein Q9195_002679 [Heterodermia aff. obscurata]
MYPNRRLTYYNLYIFALISLVILLIHFSSAEFDPPSYVDAKNVTAMDWLEDAEVPTEPDYIFPRAATLTLGKIIPTKGRTPMMKKADEMQTDTKPKPKDFDPEDTIGAIPTLTKRRIPAGITQDPLPPSTTATPTPSNISSIDISSMDPSRKKRSVPMGVNVGPILADDILSGGLVVEEPNGVNDRTNGKFEETWKRNEKGERGSRVYSKGQAGKAGWRRRGRNVGSAYLN